MQLNLRHTIRVHFEDIPDAAQGQAASELSFELERRLALEQTSNGVSIEVQRARSETMDFGATLVIILGYSCGIGHR